MEVANTCTASGGISSSTQRLTPHTVEAMQQKKTKTAVVAFKIEEDLADFLNQLPNKSAFIRKAIRCRILSRMPARFVLR